MKTILAIILAAAQLATAATGDYLFQKKTSTGYEPVLLTPENGKVIGWTSGNLANVVGGGGSGTVTSVSVTTANGVSGSVATATTTPAITLTLGAITPTSVVVSGITTLGDNVADTVTLNGYVSGAIIPAATGVTPLGTNTKRFSDLYLTGAGVSETGFEAPEIIAAISISSGGTVSASGNVTGANLSGTNTGDQTNITGNAGTVTSIGDLTGVVTSTNRATAISDAALSIAKTNGLQTALNGKKADSMATNKLLGRGTAGTGSIEEITLGTNLTLSGTTLNAAGGTVDNAAVNTAIETSPATTRASLGVERRNNLAVASVNFRNVTKNLRMVTFGDSLVNNPPLNLSSVFSPSGGYSRAVDSIDVSGSSLVTDWAYPGGQQIDLPSGATRRWGTYNVTASAAPFLRASKFNVYYVRGVGTLRLRSATGVSTSFADITGHTAIDTSAGGAAGTIGIRAVTMSGGQAANFYRLDTVSDSGTIKIIGVEALEETTRENLQVWNLGLGGSFDSSWISTTQTNWTAMLTSINPSLIVFKAADFHVIEGGTDWSITLDRIRTAAPNAVMLLVDSHPWSGNTSPTTDSSGWAAALKSYAALNAPMVQFCETRKFWPSYATMLSNALISGDGIHLTTAGEAFENSLLLDYVQTLTAPAEYRDDQASQIRPPYLPGVTGTIQSRYLSGPAFNVIGDLWNADGFLGLGSVVGGGGSFGFGPTLAGFSVGGGVTMSGGLALGLSRTNHIMAVQSSNNFAMFLGRLGDSKTAITRNASGQVEIHSAGSTTIAPLALSVISGQTGDMARLYTGATLASAGTQVGGMNKDGIYFHTPVAHTATTAAIPVTSQTTALTTTAAAQAISLANGIPGQVKTITHVATSGGGTAVLTPSTKTGYTTITFAAVGDTVTLKFYATYGWMIESIRGATAA